MTNSRRLFSLVLVFAALGAFAQKPVRLSWQEFAKDPKRVQSFRNAVAKMRSRDAADPASADFRRSWTYWASMHGFFGPESSRGTVAQWRAANNLDGPEFDATFTGVVDTTPPDAIAKAVWGQCQHGTDYFFPWHRLYLHYFERVLQEAAGDSSLRLPYWDYTNPQQLRMPAEFTTPTYVNASGQTVPNPLFETRREPGWNAPGTNALSSTDTNIDQTLDATPLLTTSGYQRRIELSPHGYAHCAVEECRATVMGAVPYSANDPIFYIHHANIDRLWDCWLSIKGHKNPDTTGFLDKDFSFVNEKGALVTRKVRALFETPMIDYVYQQPSNCARKARAVTLASTPRRAVLQAAKMLARPMMIAEEKDDMTIDGPVSKKRVTLPATATLAHPRQFALREQDDLPVVAELVLRGIRFSAHPGTEFLIYLERGDDASRRALVGTLSFFSEEATGDAHHQAAPDDRYFDVTDALRSLNLDGTGALEVNVVLEVETDGRGPEFNPGRARLVIDEIELHVRRDL